MADKAGAGSGGGEVQLETARAVEAFGSGVRTSLRNNASAYGFSVSITAAFGLVSSSHSQSAYALQVILFAAGAAAGFVLVESVAARWFKRLGGADSERVVMISGAVDAAAVAAAVGCAVGLAQVPGIAAWPLTSFATTLVYLVVGGVDVLVARRAVRRDE